MSMRGGRIAAIVGILLVWTVAGSCDRGSLFHALDPYDPPEYSLSGTVRDARTGVPLIGATLKCGDATTTSGDWGEYGFIDLNSQAYTLTASREGYRDFGTKVEIESEDLRYDVEMQPR